MLDLQPPPDFASSVQQLAQQFTTVIGALLATVDATIIDVARLAYVSVLMAGLLLYFSHVERRLGKDLIKGGVALAVLSEFVFPALVRL